MHGLVVLDRTAGCCARRSSGTTSARGAVRGDRGRVGLERLIALTGNRALTGFTAPKLLWLREHEPDVLRADPPHSAAEGLRALPDDRRACDRRRGRLRHAAVRRRRPALVAGGLRRARDPARRGCRRCYESTEVAGRAAIRRPRHSASGSSRPGWSRSCSAPRGSCSRCCRPICSTGRRACTSSATRLPGTWHAMGVMLSAAGSLAWLRGVVGGDYATWTRRRERWAPGIEGLSSPPTWPASARPHADPDAAERSPV